jgi:hypothetical protein
MKHLGEGDIQQVGGGSIFTLLGQLAYQVGAQDAAFYSQIPAGTVLF